VGKDVLESENQIHWLIDSLGPFLLSGTGLSGLGLGPGIRRMAINRSIYSVSSHTLISIKYADQMNQN